MSCRSAAAVALTVAAFSSSAVAQEAATGRAKAQPCAVCHGPLGMSTAPDAPNLAGQPAMYLAAQLRAYKSRERRHEVMNVMAQNLSNDDIAQLAAWYSSIRIEARPPN